MVGKVESIFEIIKATAIDVLGLSDEAASHFAHIATSKVTGFFLRFDNMPEHLILKNVKFDGKRFVAEWESVSTHADCPMCGKTSGRQHSKRLYSEMVQDVGIGGKALWHQINRKKYICTNDHCIQVNFLEGFPGFIEMRRARMTAGFAELVANTAVNTSSNAAAGILREQGAEISRDTVVRVTLRRGAKQVEENFYDRAGEVVNVGIDDINLRKGDNSTSCMVVVNLDTGKLLGIVRGTTGEVAQQALALFPNLDIVSRDRGTAMASAAQRLGKKSVADRFHITANMHDAIERTLYETLPASMYIPIGDSWVHMSNDSESGEVVVAEIPASLTEKDIKLRVRMAHLSANAEIKYRQTLQVLELALQGKHAEEISGIMGIPTDKVRKLRSEMRETISSVEKKIDDFIAAPHGSVGKQKSVTTSAQHSSKSIVEPYRDVVVSMRRDGKSHWTIHEEICKLGFEGSHSTVDNYIIKLERESSIDAEIMAVRSAANDWFASIPERPERISVRIYSAGTVYRRVLAKIKEYRYAENDETQAPHDERAAQASDSKKKTSAVPATRRMNIPLELVDVLNWRDVGSVENKLAADADAVEVADRHISDMNPVYAHMIRFGMDYHKFMDNNDLAGLHEFIDKYRGDSYWRLAKFANGLQMDIDAVENALIYPDISNGVVEGINSIIKCVKRVCGGKAKIDLLTAKMVLRHKGKAPRTSRNTA